MLKTIAAALLAVSVIAAPAMAATGTPQAPAAKTAQVKSSVLNANAKMGHSHRGRHHIKHSRRHHAHKRVGAFKTHRFSKVGSSKVTAKHVTPAIKRG